MLNLHISVPSYIGLIDFESARKNLFTENQDLYEVALNMWNRAAIQGNVDARVKMGDYHFYGLGLPAQGTSSDKHSVTKGQESDQSSSSSTSPADSSYSSWLATLIPSIFSHSPFPWLNSFFNSVGQVLVLVPPQPVGNRSPNYEKAALYYQVAAETQYSALAIWNLGYMHELGIGVNKVIQKQREHPNIRCIWLKTIFRRIII